MQDGKSDEACGNLAVSGFVIVGEQRRGQGGGNKSLYCVGAAGLGNQPSLGNPEGEAWAMQ